MDKIKFSCPHCGKALSVSTKNAGKTATCPGCGQPIQVPLQSPPEPSADTGIPSSRPGFKEYKVLLIAESGISTLLLGSGKLPAKKIETVLNEEAPEGWQVVFQVIEKKRFLLFWTREALLVTLGR
jgi:hypothetical protein